MTGETDDVMRPDHMHPGTQAEAVAAPKKPQEKFDDLMWDIETMGIHTSNSLILSFALVPFKIRDEGPVIGPSYLVLPNILQQFAMGRRADDPTQDFWARQSAQAKEHWANPDYRPGDNTKLVTPRFEDMDLEGYFMEMGVTDFARMWANGIAFDLGNIQHWRNNRMPYPYNAARDSRTLMRHVKKARQRPREQENNNLHDPVADCISQIWGLWEIWPNLDQESFDQGC